MCTLASYLMLLRIWVVAASVKYDGPDSILAFFGTGYDRNMHSPHASQLQAIIKHMHPNGLVSFLAQAITVTCAAHTGPGWYICEPVAGRDRTDAAYWARFQFSLYLAQVNV